MIAGVFLAVAAAVAHGPSASLAEEHQHQMEHGDHHDASASKGGMSMGIERLPTPKGMSIALVKPDNDTKVKIKEPLTVTVKTEGMDTASDHWHIYIDDEMAAMVGAGRTEYQLDTKDISPGPHKLSVAISNGEHKEYDQVDSRNITAE